MTAGSIVLLVFACYRPQSAPTPVREPPAPSAQTSPSRTSTTSGSPGAAPPPPAPNAPPPNVVAAKFAGPPREGCDALFEPPAGADKLCDEHTRGEGATVHWTSWAVKASPEDTFEHYRERAAACGATSSSEPPMPSVRKGDARLSVHDAKETGYPSCATKPGADRPSVVVISTKGDRR